MGVSSSDHEKRKRKKNISFGSIFMHADGWDVALAALGLLGACGDGISMPVTLLVTSRLMNSFGHTHQLSLPATFSRSINENALALCYIACGQWVACFLEGYCWTRTAERQASRLRTRYLKAVMRQDVGYFDLHVTSTAEVIESVSSDSLVIQDTISEKVPVFVMNLSMFFGCYVVAFIMLWRLAIVGFPFIVFLVIPGLMYGRALMGMARKILDEYSKASVIVEQALSSVRTVYSFAGESRTIAAYSAALQGTVKLGLRQGLAKGLAIGSNGVVFAIWSFMSYYGSRLVMYHGEEGGTVFAVGAAIAIGGLSLGSGLSNLKYFSEAGAVAERIKDVIKRVPKIDSDSMEGQILEDVSGEIELKHVRFNYPSRPESVIFEDFNLIVPAGKTVALVGGSGSGKSTVIALLQRFYDPLGGEILLDGVAIDKLQLKWLRSKIGLVSQEPALFATTIMENILFGKEDASMEEVIEAAKASNAHNFITQLPQGYETQVGERGVQMSGGQKQRIAIARAIIKAPQILLLDEATSALDSESERVVQEALDKAAMGRTTIVIAHRLSTIRNADLIAVVQNGQVMEIGPHDHLIENDQGLYTSLIRLQQIEKTKEYISPYITGTSIASSDIHNTSNRRLSVVSSSGSANSVRGMDTVVVARDQVFQTPSFRRLLAMNLPEWKQAMLGCIGAVLFGLIQPLYAFAMGSMISVYFHPDHDEIKEKTKISLGSGLSNLKYFSEAGAVAERIKDVIKRVPKIDSDSMEGQILEDVSGEIELKHVRFNYPSRPESVIFEDFNLIVPAGKTVALVGGSGSGKSTVIALLQRFYDPLGGEILLDGVAIDKLQLKWLRSKIGLVSQEPALFATTIMENILFGKEDASMEEVIEAAKASNAHNFITQLPQGYETQVGERGVQMSGGQKQRIAIARAIIKAPQILLLDEATSALDSESERVVQEALDKAAMGRTTIVIAHRLSTIRNADLIAVVQNGQVMEIGPHDHLIENDQGLYTSLIRLQQIEKTKEYISPYITGTSIASSDIHNTSNRRLSVVSSSGSANSVRGMDTVVVARDQVFQTPSFRRLLAMNLPEWKQAMLGCIGAVLFGLIQPLYAFAMGSMISVYFHPDHDEIKEKTKMYALCFLGLAVFSLLINVCQHYNFAAMGENLTKRIREKILSKILTFEIGWFDQDENATGAICSRLAKDANVVRSLVGDRMALLIQTFSTVIIACTMGLVIAWKLALVMIAVQPLIIICYYLKRVLLKNMSKKAMKSQEESSKLAAEAVSNLRTVTAFSSQARILKMLEKAQEGPKKESIRQSWFAGIGLGTSQSLMTCTWALDFWYGGKLLAEGFIGAKALFQTFMILVSTGRVIADAGTMTNDLAKGADAVGSIFAVLDRYSLIEPEDPDGYEPEKLTGRVELQDIDFAYPTRPDTMIFRGFSINIEAGTSTALVGQSGSGKSTIIGLIERFYDPLRGVVKIDGRDIKSYHLRSMRKHIALVSQEPTLFAGTIRQNIIYGASEDVGEAEVIEAAKAANAHDFIAGLKDSYDTFCGDRGLQLSGGQKQRIAIARAILKNPAILLLDEATSALDSQSEKVVQDALERVMVGRTSVVVAHRLSSIQNCDTIVVLDKGKVVEKGNHSSLLAKGQNGAYYALVSLQRSPGTTQTISSPW